jgi:hypothetical protein
MTMTAMTMTMTAFVGFLVLRQLWKERQACAGIPIVVVYVMYVCMYTCMLRVYDTHRQTPWH